MSQTNDKLVKESAIGVIPDYYKALGVNMSYVRMEGLHQFPSLSTNSTAYDIYPANVSNYDGAGTFLRHVYDDIKDREIDWLSKGKFSVVS